MVGRGGRLSLFYLNYFLNSDIQHSGFPSVHLFLCLSALPILAQSRGLGSYNLLRTWICRELSWCYQLSNALQESSSEPAEGFWRNGQPMWRCSGSSSVTRCPTSQRHFAKAWKPKLFLKWCYTFILELLLAATVTEMDEVLETMNTDRLFLLLYIFFALLFSFPPSNLPLFLPPFLLFLLHEPILGTHKVNSYWTPRPEVFFPFFAQNIFNP